MGGGALSDIGLPANVLIPCSLDLDPARPCDGACWYQSGVGPVCSDCFEHCLRARAALGRAGLVMQPFEEGHDA